MKVTIRLKLMALTMGVILLVGGGISLYSMFHGREKLLGEFSVESENIVAQLSKTVANDVYNLDVFSLRLRLKNIRDNPDVRDVFIMDGEGVVLADGTSDNALRDTPFSDPFSRKILTAESLVSNREGADLRVGGPILLPDGSHIGYIYLVFSFERIDQVIRESAQASIFLTLIFLGIGAILAFFLSTRFTRPILVLVEATRAIGEGKFDTRIKITGKDELGLLGASVNQLAVDLREKTVSKEYFNKIISSMAEMLVFVNAELTIQTVNVATCKALGYDLNELIGKPLSLIIAEGPLHEIRDLVDDELAWSGESRYLTKEGIEIPVSFSVSAMKGGGDQLRGIVCVAQDITERKKVEKALELTQFSLDFASDPVFFMESNAHIFYVNDAACRGLGYSRAELLSMSVPEIDPNFTEEVWKKTWKGFKKNKSLRIESHHRTKDGRIFPVEVRVTYAEFRGKKYSCAFVRDLTEQKYLEKELRHSQKLEGIGQLAGGIAHEFNNLLTAIIGNLNVAMNDIENTTKIQPLLSDAEHAAKRAAALTQQLLAFGRQSSFDPQPQNLSVIVKEATTLLRQTIDRRIVIRPELDDDLWNVMADADSIHQVIMNLCVNARDALMERLRSPDPFPNWEPVISVKVLNVKLDEDFCRSRSGLKPGDHVLLSVSDNGSGIDKSIQEKIFDPFFTTKDIGKGTGLGLASVYGIVKQHQGWIKMTSTGDGGSTFRIYLARTIRGVYTEPERKVTPSAIGGSETILLVDDEPVLRQLGQTILEYYGYKVVLAEDGEEALKIFSQDSAGINLVVLDLTMPKLSGWELIRELFRICPGLKVIVLSGHRITDPTNSIQSNDRVEYMMKPYQPKELAQKVREVLDQDERPSKVTG